MIFDYTELPSLPESTDDIDELPSIMEEYFSIPVPDGDLTCVATLNSDQQIAYDTIMNVVISKGRTSHSTFQLPLNPDSSSTCSFTKRSKTVILLKNSSIIVWDEDPMTHRYQFKVVDRSLKDLMGNDLPFGGKIILFGGDFRQVLPVVRNGTRAQMIEASFVRSPMWRHIRILRLRENMRLIDDNGFANFLLSVGNGNEPTISDQMIRLPTGMVIPSMADSSIEALIDQVFPSLSEHVGDGNFIVEREIITPLNEDVDRINNKVVEKFLGEGKTYYSFDYVPEGKRNLYQQEFLNSISTSGLPPHALTLKPGDNFIDAEVLIGHSRGNRVFLPRIPLKTTEDIKLPFEMVKKKFPVKLSFALTINKSLRQTIPHVCIYLPDHVFSHGHLYVALPRGILENTTKIVVGKGKVQYCQVAAYACRVDHVDKVIYEACNPGLKKVVIFQGLQKCQSCNITNAVTAPTYHI
ncbi:uncharacterized protein [Spinacia oleracea]|uniref:ATP-dependent DNA helicase n=1 Tax=Spinacia oleracea TaxID=3562 RepID=A0ABM3RRC9_SPIOL|nr:uncharacterized protein LOC110802864 [Spinacia oleracea]